MSPLCFLMAVIVGSTGWGVVGGCVGIEDPHVKNALSYRLPQKPLTRMSRRAPLSVDGDLRWKVSPVIGWRTGSTAMSEQTFVRREARRSLTSLWRTVGNPPVGQFRAC